MKNADKQKTIPQEVVKGDLLMYSRWKNGKYPQFPDLGFGLYSPNQ